MILRTYEYASEKLDDRLIDLEEELEKLRLSRTEQASYSMPLSAFVAIVAEHAGEAEIALVYAVPNASWQASYDIRIDMQSKDAPFAVRYKAVISQCTGEDWDSVRLTLDTFTPTFGAEVPSLGSCRLTSSESVMVQAAQPQQYSRSRSPRRGVAYHSERYRARSRSYTRPNHPSRFMTRATIPPSGFGALGATYDIPGLISIPDEARAHTVTIAELELDAVLSKSAKEFTDVFNSTQAQVKNASEYTLVAAPANVYIDRSFVSRSHIPDVNPQESFECSLGVDPSTRITHAPLSKKVSSSALINKTITAAYFRQITIRNAKSIVIEGLKVLDRIPVAEDSQIVVKLINPALSLPKPLKMERSPLESSGMPDKAKGFQSTKSSVTSSVKVAETVIPQWEGEDVEEGVGEMG
ncbi:hypothetical protein BDN71DRAFT_1542717 [Pleurotus eryngii]|uniref:DUF4139 domain-containing protein n=1 Tax=Pleurotus eryngii TaxID=5323 RepID=A0A9P5ZIU4_PLEER|nr:hypothetical protein BDN71DRAFT_1542717 [Pleurotus eryngii]